MRRDILLKYASVILILSYMISPALAYDVQKFQWSVETSGKLMRGDELSFNEYTVKAVAFPAPVKSGTDGLPIEPVDPFIKINLSKDGILLNSTLLLMGEYIIVPDGEIKVAVTQLPSKQAPEYVYETYAPWGVVEISQRGKPAIDVSVETDYSEYVSLPNTEITATVTISNSGTADLLNADLEVKTSLPLKRGTMKYHYDRIIKGESITNTITFSTPIITELENHRIVVNATGYDAKDLFYSAQSSNDVLIAPEPEQIPTLRKNVNARIYLDEMAMVSLVFKNNANYELKNVSITDSIPQGFKLLNNNSLHWVVNVPAKSEWENRYLIKPVEANREGAALPQASADFKTMKEYYSILSNQVSMIVYGPKISLTKQTDVSAVKPGEKVTVTVIAENVGSAPTKVTVIDELPNDVTFESGTTSADDFLEAGKSVTISYVIRVDSEQPVRLPAARAEFYELSARSGKLTAISGEPEIGIKTPESESAANAEGGSPSFEITEVQPTPVPTPELPFTPILDEEPVPPETPPPVVTPVPVPDIMPMLNLLIGCNETGMVNNGSYIACNFIKIS